MRKLQVAAAAASLFAVAGVAQAATLNSSGSVIAAETIFPGTTGDNTRIKAPAFTYQYEGGVVAASRQIFKVAVNLTSPAQWTLRATQLNRDTDPILGGANATSWTAELARTIIATATVNGQTGRVAVLAGTDPAPGQYAIRLNRVEAGDTIAGSPLVSSQDSAVTFVFELVNNTPDNGVNLAQLSLQFATFKSPAVPVLPNSAPDTVTTAINQYPTIYNLGALSVDTNNAACALPQGSVRLQAVSGNNDPAALSQEDTVSNQGTLRDVANYIRIGKATNVALAKSGDRLVQTTNSFQTNLGSTPINGAGGTGGGRFTFKPSTTQVANVYGGDFNAGAATGLFSVDNTVNGANNATLRGVGTFPERRTSGDERAAKLGVLSFSNLGGNALDRLIDLDAYGFKAATVAQLPDVGFSNAVSHVPSDLGAVSRQVGDFTAVTPPISTEANLYGGVDISGVGPTAVNESGAVVIGFTSKANFGWRAAGGGLTLQRGNVTCADTAPAGSLIGSLVNPGGGTAYFWRFSRAELAGASVNGTLAGDWTVCYNVTGESTIPAATFTNVFVRVLKDDTTEQNLLSCSASLASIYGGVKIDVRNFQLHNVLPTSTADDKLWRGILRVINNSESDTATVEAQYIHADGRYGMWGTLGTWAPRAARYVFDTEIWGALTNAVANPTPTLVNNSAPTTQTVRLRISSDVSTLRVQNYIYHAGTQALTEVSSTQGADFVNVDSSNRDHLDQDAQFDIVKDTATLSQQTTTVGKGALGN
ncbi:hypothetical protein ABXN37_01630 [Piscinibacter sakaiensis]|uniref:Uncharacterized protein n=1 Tax=Piscinibacter sakaiensis TaxID=1547922 RepID=A0A0K8NTX5_PISS1|nr:hypothetical protein [Piscinibacter sakaiensis]GAP33871.1 hypothetical protein ISF6_1126 [Piscinibacter sakaiensis]